MYNLQIYFAQTHGTTSCSEWSKIFHPNKYFDLSFYYIVVETVIRQHLMVLRVINKREWLDGGGLQKEEK